MTRRVSRRFRRADQRFDDPRRDSERLGKSIREFGFGQRDLVLRKRRVAHDVRQNRERGVRILFQRRDKRGARISLTERHEVRPQIGLNFASLLPGEYTIGAILSFGFHEKAGLNLKSIAF